MLHTIEKTTQMLLFLICSQALLGCEPAQHTHYRLPVVPLAKTREKVPTLTLLTARAIARQILKQDPLPQFNPAHCFEQSLSSLPDDVQDLLFEQIAQHPQALVRLPKLVARISHPQHVNDIRFTYDNKSLITVSDDPFIRIWDFESTMLIKTIPTDDAKLYAIHLTRDGEQLIVGGANKIHVWSIKKDRLDYRIGLKHECVLLDTNHDTSLLAFALDRSKIALWNLNTKKVQKKIRYDQAIIKYFRFDHDKPGIFVHTDGSLRYWNTHTGACIKRYNLEVTPSSLLAIDPVLQLVIFIAHEKSPITFQYLDGLQMIGDLAAADPSIRTFCCNNQETLMITGLKKGSLLFFDLEKRICLGEQQIHTNKVASVCISQNGRLWASIASEDSSVALQCLDTRIKSLEELLKALTDISDRTCMDVVQTRNIKK